MTNEKGFAKILVPLDGSKNADRALTKAIFIAEKFQSELILVHIIDEYFIDFTTDMEGYQIPNSTSIKIKKASMENAKGMLKKRHEKVQKRKINCKYEVIVGDVSEKIINYSKENSIDLIVIGARGLGKFKQLLLGSISNKVSIGSGCPVMIVK